MLERAHTHQIASYQLLCITLNTGCRQTRNFILIVSPPTHEHKWVPATCRSEQHCPGSSSNSLTWLMSLKGRHKLQSCTPRCWFVCNLRLTNAISHVAFLGNSLNLCPYNHSKGMKWLCLKWWPHCPSPNKCHSTWHMCHPIQTLQRWLSLPRTVMSTESHILLVETTKTVWWGSSCDHTAPYSSMACILFPFILFDVSKSRFSSLAASLAAQDSISPLSAESIAVALVYPFHNTKPPQIHLYRPCRVDQCSQVPSCW